MLLLFVAVAVDVVIVAVVVLFVAVAQRLRDTLMFYCLLFIATCIVVVSCLLLFIVS